MRPATAQTLFLIALLVLNLTGLPVWGQNPATLEILIVEGEGAINNVKQRVNREPIVQVEDENHKPVAGAAVTFFLPNDGVLRDRQCGGRQNQQNSAGNDQLQQRHPRL